MGTKAVRQFVEKAIGGYNRVCGEKPWHMKLDLGPAITSASLTVAEACEGEPPEPEEVEALAMDLYKLQLHKVKVDTVMWELITDSIPVDEKAQTKFYKSLSGAYTKAFEVARAPDGKAPAFNAFKRGSKKGKGKGKDKAGAERFIKEWISDTLIRSRHMIQNSDGLLTPDTFVEFFACLLTPFDKIDSCMPVSFKVGKVDWRDFVQTTIEALYTEWENAEKEPQGKKRKAK